MSSEALNIRETVVEEALKWLGFPGSNHRGPELGKSPEGGFDCSGFVFFVLSKTGVEIPKGIRHCSQFFDKFGVLIHHGLQKTGDLVFFSRDGLKPTHMGIMLGDDEYIHSPGRKNNLVEIAVLKKKRIKINDERAIYNINPIGFKRISIKDDGRWQEIS